MLKKSLYSSSTSEVLKTNKRREKICQNTVGQVLKSSGHVNFSAFLIVSN